MDYTHLLSMITGKLNFAVFILVIAGGYAAKRYFVWEHVHIGSFRCAITDAWKTLITGSVFCAVYAAILMYNKAFTVGTNEIFFFSYVSATSFYELLLKPFSKMFNKVTGAE